MKIAISTGGGDAPGLNAVIRAVVLGGMYRGFEVCGIHRGFGGLLEEGQEGQEEQEMRVIPLGRREVRGIAHLGGTILGTTNRGNPFRWAVKQPDGSTQEVDRSDELIEKFRARGFDVLVMVGGDGSLRIAYDLYQKGLPVVGVPKTIDNDVGGTVITFGYDTAVTTATEAIDKVHSTAESHERVMVVEVMGRYAGWIALNSGLAGGADVILIPEIPYDIHAICRKVAEREAAGRHFTIVVVAEGAVPKGGHRVVLEGAHAGTVERLGGVGERVAEEISQVTGKETRSLVLGHLQRGGSPTTFDRLTALRFGAAAVRAVAEGRFGCMVALDPPEIKLVPLADALARPKRVALDSDSVQTARELGICLGD